MVKKLLVALFLLCVFAAPSYAATTPPSGVQFKPVPPPIPQPNAAPQYVPDQLIVTYTEGQSPQQLSTTITRIEKTMATPLGYLKTQALVLLGKQKPLSVYTNSLKNIQEAYKKTKVTNSELISTASNKQTEVVTVEKGVNLDSAIKTFKSLPEVKSVDKNYYRFPVSGRVASEDESLSPDIAPNQYIIQYAPGQSPPQIEQAVKERKNAKSSLTGSLRIAAEDTGSSITGSSTPEEKLQRINHVRDSVGQKKQEPLITSTASLPTNLQEMYVVQTDGKTPLSETIQSYQSLPGVLSVEPVRYLYPNVTPNDQYYNKQWSLPKVQAPAAWDVSKGNDSVTVAVIDTGVDYSHPDLSGHVINGRDFANNDDDSMDDCGHGTHVAGIVGAQTNNSLGIAGLNWNVKILALKVMKNTGEVDQNGMPECPGLDPWALQAIQYAADNGAKVINMSLGGIGPCPSSYQQIINYARNKGVTIVVAAGNGNTDAANTAPGNCPGVITIGATGPNDARSSFSNYGTNVSIAAPGGDAPCQTNCIFSTFILNGQEGYIMMAGTSQAAPHVAGAAALYLSTHPGASPDTVKNALVSSADPINTDKSIGPRLNLAKLMGASTSPTTSPSPTSGDTTPTGTLSPSPTPTRVPGTSPTPTPTRSATITPTIPQPTAIPTLPPGNWEISIPVQLPGIGNGPGDNSNPQNQTRAGDLIFVDSEGKETKSSIGNFEYKNGIFSMEYTDALIAATDFPPKPGIYQVKIMMNNTLPKLVPGFYYINEFPTHNKLVFPTIVLTVGDINNDGVLDVLDYNAILNCIKGACNNTTAADLNDDGTVDAKDLNILLRQFANRAGN